MCRRLVKWGIFLFLVSMTWVLSAQIPSREPSRELARTDLYVLPKQDNDRLLADELSKRRPGRAPRFAVSVPVAIDLRQGGTWEQPTPTHWVWRQRIRSDGAHSLNLGFSRFQLPAGALLYLYSSDGTQRFGPLTAADNDAHATYWSPALRAEEIIVELQVPEKQKEEVLLTISHVNHDFLGIGKVVSGSCNLDVACSAREGWPLVDRYRDLVQSVGLMTVDGSSYCTGFLVNNVRNDCRPFFMTAEHCDIKSDNAASVVVYWNYQNSYCREPGSINSAGQGNGDFNQVNSGAVWRAGYRPSDFTLLELDDPVLPEANAYFAGWSARREAFTDTAFTVHHPSNEEKRISFEYDEVYLGRWQEGTQAFDDGNHVIVRNWEVGTTEEGSSGGPLFNKSGQVIGQLHGGRAACNNSDYDAFGWFGLSWEGEDHPTNSLKFWLDPDRSGKKEWLGRWNKSCQKFMEATTRVRDLCPEDTTYFTLFLSEAFEGDVFLEPVALPAGIRLLPTAQRSYRAGQDVRLPVVLEGRPPQGNYPFVIRAYDTRDTVTITLEAEVHYLPGSFELLTPLGDSEWTGETLRFSWSNSSAARQYRFVLARDPEYRTILAERVTTDTQYVFDQLNFNTTYYWQVTAASACGTIVASGGSFRTGPDLQLSLVAQPERICSTETVQYLLRIGQDYGTQVQLSYETATPGAVDVVFGDGQTDRFAGGEEVPVTMRLYDPVAGSAILVTIRAEENDRRSSLQWEVRPQGRPSPASLLDPFEKAVRLPEALTVRWNTAAWAERYELRIGSGPDLQERIVTRQLTDTLYRPATALTAGLYYWQVVAQNGCGSSPSEVWSFRVQDNALGKLNETSIAVEPNPAFSVINVHVSRPLQGATLSLYSLTGELLERFPVAEDKQLLQIDVSPYPAGMYVVRLQQRQSSLSRRIIVIR